MSSGPTAGAADASGAPWYTQFWPWFLVALPTAAVVASIASLVLAVRNADSLVRSDWSAAGDAINDSIALEHEAARRAIVAELRFDARSGMLTLRLVGHALEGLERVRLALRHPGVADRDREFTLDSREDGSFAAPVADDLRGDWYATLFAGDGSWMIERRIVFRSDEGAAIVPSG